MPTVKRNEDEHENTHEFQLHTLQIFTFSIASIRNHNKINE